jgi:hypothetical protein
MGNLIIVRFHFTRRKTEPNGLLFKRNLFVPDLMSTKLLRRVDYATGKGEEMEHKSKGNFMDFIEEASGKSSQIREQFIAQLYKEDQTAEGLLKFFYDSGYDGVSLEDCGKMLRVAPMLPPLQDFDRKY